MIEKFSVEEREILLKELTEWKRKEEEYKENNEVLAFKKKCIELFEQYPDAYYIQYGYSVEYHDYISFEYCFALLDESEKDLGIYPIDDKELEKIVPASYNTEGDNDGDYCEYEHTTYLYIDRSLNIIKNYQG